MKTTAPLAQLRGTGSLELQKIQDYMRGAVAPLLAIALLNGVLINYEVDASGARVDGLNFSAATAKTVLHRLGRKPNGWMVVRDYGTARNQLLEDSTRTDATSMTLTSATACKVYLWVF